MGRIVSNFFISLDGVVEAPNEWHFPYFDDAMGAIIGEGMSTTTAFLMGRTLYGEWSSYWPGQGPEVPFSEFINTIPKYVVSSSLSDPAWQNTTVVPGDVAAVQALKERTDGDIGDAGQRHPRAVAARRRSPRRAGAPRAPDRGRLASAAVREQGNLPAQAGLLGHPRQRRAAPALRARVLTSEPDRLARPRGDRGIRRPPASTRPAHLIRGDATDA